jgi:hypothetical protein
MAGIDSRWDEGAWVRLLRVAALTTGTLMVALIAVFLAAMARAVDAPDEVFEVGVAAGSPLLYRLYAFIDALVWIGAGTVLVAFAGALRSSWTTRAWTVAACGAAQAVGAFGGFLRLYGVGSLGARYEAGAADPVAEAVLSVVYAAFSTGAVIHHLAFLLIAVTILSTGVLPRWYAALMLVVAGAGQLLTLVEVVTGADLGDVGIVVVLGLVALMFSTAFVVRRRTQLFSPPSSSLR